MKPGNLIKAFMAFFFKLLYNQFAWTYDLVANIVSFGQWQEWVRSIHTLIDPIPTLELGFGPGHLQEYLLRQNIPAFGFDLSKYMSRIAVCRITAAGLPHKLVQATSSHMPFSKDSFPQVIATFPSEYIIQPETIAEISRVLKPDGKLVILVMVTISGNSFSHKLINWIYRLTNQTADFNAQQQAIFLKPFLDHGFSTQIKSIPKDFYTLTYLQASRSGN